MKTDIHYICELCGRDHGDNPVAAKECELDHPKAAEMNIVSTKGYFHPKVESHEADFRRGAKVIIVEWESTIDGCTYSVEYKMIGTPVKERLVTP